MFATLGWSIFRSSLAEADLQNLRAAALVEGPGQRCLLDLPTVRHAAMSLCAELVPAGLLPASAVAIQAIAFDKTPAANWKVTWHQDLMFPFARKVETPGFSLSSLKDGVHYARPPRGVLEELVAVRLHLDDCDQDNGPLRIVPGSHRDGVIKGADIPLVVGRLGEAICLAKAGETLVMRPLLLHASSPARIARHRRVLHLVFHSGGPVAEPWYRVVRC